MKNIIKKIFCTKIAVSLGVGIIVFSIFTFAVFPFLTASNTILNILGGVIGAITLLFLFFYIDDDRFFTPISIHPGETELDYIPKEEIEKVTKKKVNKPKKKTKSEFPLPPHQPRKKNETK